MIAALWVVFSLQLQPVAPVAPVADVCTPAELAEYERRGWDGYECDGDKAAEAAGDFAE